MSTLMKRLIEEQKVAKRRHVVPGNTFSSINAQDQHTHVFPRTTHGQDSQKSSDNTSNHDINYIKKKIKNSRSEPKVLNSTGSQSGGASAVGDNLIHYTNVNAHSSIYPRPTLAGAGTKKQTGYLYTTMSQRKKSVGSTLYGRIKSIPAVIASALNVPFIAAVILSVVPLGFIMNPSSNIITYTFQPIIFSLPLSSEVISELKILQHRSSSVENDQNVEFNFRKVGYTEFTLTRGDTLSEIASEHNITISTLASFNKISNARALQAGKTYRIPDREGLLHVVKNGENLEGIVNKYSADINAVLDANDLPDAAIAQGVELFIPGAQMSDWDLRLLSGELFSYPVVGYLTSGYGYRNDPFTGIRRFHYGIDLGAPVGRVVRSAMEGQVSYIGNQSGGYGKYVIVRHPGGFQTLYAHLNGFNVRNGQFVARGEVIGWIGNTGRSTGPHLHFSIIKNGKFQNPFNYL